MQVYVQNPARTTFPLRLAGVSGGELSQPVAPLKEGNSPSTGSRSEGVCSPAGAGQCAVMTMISLLLDVLATACGPAPSVDGGGAPVVRAAPPGWLAQCPERGANLL